MHNIWWRHWWSDIVSIHAELLFSDYLKMIYSKTEFLNRWYACLALPNRGCAWGKHACATCAVLSMRVFSIWNSQRSAHARSFAPLTQRRCFMRMTASGELFQNFIRHFCLTIPSINSKAETAFGKMLLFLYFLPDEIPRETTIWHPNHDCEANKGSFGTKKNHYSETRWTNEEDCTSDRRLQ